MWDVLKEYPTARIRLEAIATKRLEKYKTDPSPDDKLEGELKPMNRLKSKKRSLRAIRFTLFFTHFS